MASVGTTIGVGTAGLLPFAILARRRKHTGDPSKRAQETKRFLDKQFRRRPHWLFDVRAERSTAQDEV